MGIFDALLKGISQVGKSSSKATAQLGSKATRAAEIAKGSAKSTTKAAGITTKTAIAADIAPKASPFKLQAQSILFSKPVKTAGVVGGTAVVIGGATYAAGSLSGKGLSDIGYGWRNLTDSRTPEEIRNDQLNNMEKENGLLSDKIDTLKNYTDFLSSNGLTDSPSTRDIFDEYISGDGTAAADTGAKATNWGGVVLGLGAIASGVFLISQFVKKKKSVKA
jgi:hypothetical protein